MRRAGFLALWFCAFGVAGQTPSLPPLSERIDVTVVNIDVAVLDHDGNPVPGLTAKDFEIREDDVVQPISNFEAVSGTTSKPKASADFQSDPDRQRSVVVLIDNRSLLDKPRRSRAVAEIERLLDGAADDSNWSVVTLRKGRLALQTTLPLTSDRAVIHAALAAIAAGAVPSTATEPMPSGRIKLDAGGPDCPAGGCVVQSFRDAVDAAQDMHSAASFFESVVTTARGMAWLPGRKAMLIISSKVPGYIVPAAGEEAAREAVFHDAMVREANAANVSLFVVDPVGPTQSPSSAAYWLAALTGGTFMPSNRLDQSIAKFDSATSNYYSLGYHSQAAEGSFHRIHVALDRPGRYTLMYRENFLKLSHELEFERAMATPFGIASQKSTLPVTLVVDDPRSDGLGHSIVPVHISMPMASATLVDRSDGQVGRLHIYVSVFDSAGLSVAFHHYVETFTNADAETKTELEVSHGLRLSKGTYRIFATIRDELSDAVGVAAKEVRW